MKQKKQQKKKRKKTTLKTQKKSKIKPKNIIKTTKKNNINYKKWLGYATSLLVGKYVFDRVTNKTISNLSQYMQPQQQEQERQRQQRQQQQLQLQQRQLQQRQSVKNNKYSLLSRYTHPQTNLIKTVTDGNCFYDSLSKSLKEKGWLSCCNENAIKVRKYTSDNRDHYKKLTSSQDSRVDNRIHKDVFYEDEIHDGYIDDYKMFSNVLNEDKRWATDADIQAFTSKSKIQIIIFKNNYKQILGSHKIHISNKYITLYYTGSHYQPLQFNINGKWMSAFTHNELPDFIKNQLDI